MGNSSLDITLSINDEGAFERFNNDIIKESMRRGLTGDIQIYFINGVIKGFRVNASFREIGKWVDFLKGK
jgi:hypothetical protein